MATPESLQFVHFTFPPSKPPFCNNNPLWPSTSGSTSSLNAIDNQRIHRPTATFSRSEAGGNTTARAADTHLPSLEKQSLAGLRPKISAEERPALHGAGLQVNRTQSESGEPQDGNRNQLVILDNNHHPLEAGAGNEAGDTSDDCDTGHIERAASQHNTFTTSELASEPHGVASPPAQAQPHPLPHASWPLQNQINQQGVDITQRTSALHFVPKASDSRDDGWTDEDTAELEHELELALGEQPVEPLLAGTSTTSSPHSVEALQDEIQSREREITEGILKELRDESQRGSLAQDLEWCEQRETQVVEGGVVAMQQQEELAQPPVGDVQDEVEDANDHEDKEATEALPAAQPKIDEQRFRLRGVRTRQLAGHQTKTTQYRVVWGEHSHRSDSWFNEDEVRMSMACKPYSHDSALQMNICRVRKMRSSLHKGRNVFEYMVDALGVNNPWIAEDQLRITLSPVLVAKLKASSLYPLSQARREVLVKHSTTPISDEWHNTSQASRGSYAQTDSALGRGVEPTTWKRGRRDIYTEISSDTDDNDPRPTKRRKPRSAPAVTPPIHLRQSPPPPTTGAEIDELHSQDDDGWSSTSIEEQHCVSRTSRSPSAAAEAVPTAAYQEWPLHGFLKCTKIEKDTIFNLEFHLVDVDEDMDISSSFQSLSRSFGIGLSAPSKSIPHTSVASFEKHNATSRLPNKRAQSREVLVPDWSILTRRRGNELTKSQESLLAKMIQDNETWTEIGQYFPDHPLQLLKDNFFKKQGGKPRKRGRKPGVRVGVV